MRMQHLWFLAACGVAMVVAQRAHADEHEFGDATPYYEDDAWYDVSEWFDGNDYNPTDEAIGRWDDETYEAGEEVTEDRDSDDASEYTTYGYNDDNELADRDWFYDYYDDGYADWNDYDSTPGYEWYSNYHDYDNDGLYDAYTSYYDTDNDGVYDSTSYYYFGESSDQTQQGKQQASDQDKSLSSKQIAVNGKVQDTKTVKVHGTQHLVANVQGSNDKRIAVDLGPKENLSAEVSQGDSIKASGPAVMVGKRPIVVAQRAEIGGKKIDVNRYGRTFQGTIEDVHKAQVRGTEHLMARVQTGDKKKLLVDLGQADSLRVTPQKGDKVNVTGVAVKTKDRPVLLARRFETSDGQVVQIQRDYKNLQQGKSSQSNRPSKG